MKITQTVLALRVPGGFSSDLGGDVPGEPQVYGRAFLMQIICIRDIYPSKTYGKQGVAKIYPHRTQCLRDSTLAKHSVLEAPMSKTHSEITTFTFQDDPMPNLPLSFPFPFLFPFSLFFFLFYFSCLGSRAGVILLCF